MLPESWITDKCPEVLDYLNKKYNLKLSGICCYYGELNQKGPFAIDNYLKDYTYLTKEQFLEMVQEKEVWEKGDILYSERFNSYRKIFLIIDEIVFVSENKVNTNLIKDYVDLNVVTKEYLELRDYKLYKSKKKEEKIVELTLEEIAEKFNVDVKSLKIKK